MIYFDAHCHLMDESVFRQAQKNDVRFFIVNTTRPEEWERVALLNKQQTGIYFCAGIHPWFINGLHKGWQNDLEDFLIRYPDAMIGEIGLDKTKPFFEQQIKVFMDCLAIAARYNRKVHIHCVKAWDEMLACLIQFREVQPLFHRFNGDEYIINKLRLFNAYFSVLNGRYLSVIRDNRLLVETDSPDGLKTPSAIPELVKTLNLDADYLYQTFREFLGEL